MKGLIFDKHDFGSANISCRDRRMAECGVLFKCGQNVKVFLGCDFKYLDNFSVLKFSQRLNQVKNFHSNDITVNDITINDIEQGKKLMLKKIIQGRLHKH